MRKVKYYDEDYCIRLIQSALSPNGKNGEINKSAIKSHILERLESIKEKYGVTHEDLLSEICFHFLSKSIIEKINNQKGCPTTFILHYVFNQLRNIERSFARGTFDKMDKKDDAMDMVAFNLEDLDNDGGWIPELADPKDPEVLLMAKQTLAELQDLVGAAELSMLLGEISIEDYCKLSGISRRTGYRRLARSRLLLEEHVVD